MIYPDSIRQEFFEFSPSWWSARSIAHEIIRTHIARDAQSYRFPPEHSRTKVSTWATHTRSPGIIHLSQNALQAQVKWRVLAIYRKRHAHSVGWFHITALLHSGKSISQFSQVQCIGTRAQSSHRHRQALGQLISTTSEEGLHIHPSNVGDQCKIIQWSLRVCNGFLNYRWSSSRTVHHEIYFPECRILCIWFCSCHLYPN